MTEMKKYQEPAGHADTICRWDFHSGWLNLYPVWQRYGMRSRQLTSKVPTSEFSDLRGDKEKYLPAPMYNAWSFPYITVHRRTMW